MPDAQETQVLIAGAGPIGLTAAIELSRRGIDCRIVDPLLEPPQYAKAVGVQPRTLEVFEGMGVLRRILDAATPMHGQIVYVNGEKTAQLDLTLPADVPFGFIAIPQYATEQVLRDELAMRGVLVGYLIGADGAHSTVRSAREGIGADSTDIGFVTRREGQLLINYGDSTIVTGPARPATSDMAGAGGRARDATGLTRDVVTGPLRLYSLLGREHTALLYADETAGPADAETFERAADAVVAAAHGHMDVYLIAAPGADVAGTVLPLVRDNRGEFARGYSASESSVYVVRPDGYLSFAAAGIDVDGLVSHLGATFA